MCFVFQFGTLGLDRLGRRQGWYIRAKAGGCERRSTEWFLRAAVCTIVSRRRWIFISAAHAREKAVNFSNNRGTPRVGWLVVVHKK